MEKLVYLLWKPRIQQDEAFKQTLLERVVPALHAQGARKLKLSVVDDAVAAGARLRVGQMEPAKSALVSFWLEQALAEAGVRSQLQCKQLYHDREEITCFAERVT